MPLGERIKQLRKEKGWSQDELAQQISSDARQISRYENGKITPSAEALVKLAEVFDVSIDYLMVDQAPRRPLRVEDDGLLEKLEDIRTLSEEDRASLFHILDAFVAKGKMKALAQHLS